MATQNYNFNSLHSEDDIFRFIDGTLLGKSGRRTQEDIDCFLEILKQFSLDGVQTPKALKLALGASRMIEGNCVDVNKRLANCVLYSLRKMEDVGLVARPSKAYYKINKALWAEYVQYKQRETQALAAVFQSPQNDIV